MSADNRDAGDPPERRNFIEKIVEEDLAAGRNGGRVHTRFPPEPNGFLHIGHAKAICVDFGIAKKYGGKCNLRFDDTNPEKEETRFVEAIQEDIRWLGFDWDGGLYYASGYFERLHELAVELIRKGKAYVCDLTADEIREHRGTLTSPGKNSPYRDRTVAENLDLFEQMRRGSFPDGARTLRAKIDMASPNLNLRDPVMVRILHREHHRTGDTWCIYPTYDWAHGQSDALEGITHSLCSLEFENHRPLYDWYLDHLSLPHRPRQTEFARLELTHTLTSKRKLRALVEDGHVEGWDDPRMPTLSGIRRRGYPPEAIRDFCERIGVAKYNSLIEYSVLESTVRDHLNRTAPRRMAVLDPLKVVITNWPTGITNTFDAQNNPEDPAAGTRPLPIGREVWIERDDFREEAPKKWHRLAPGAEVRLRYAYCIVCNEVVKDAAGEITELRCTYDPESSGGKTSDGRKVKGIIHWVSAAHARPAEVTLYEHLFRTPDPDEGGEWLKNIDPESKKTVRGYLEKHCFDAAPGERFQFERLGYFCADPTRSKPGAPAFHRIVGLRDTWGKIEKREG